MLRIKNWKEFQHYGSRDMKWIKVYKRVLDDIQWHLLSGVDAKALVMLWLLASENKGELPDMITLSFRMRMKEKDLQETIARLNHWLERDDSELLADCYQKSSLDKSRLEENREEENRLDIVGSGEPTKPKTFKDWSRQDFKDECSNTCEGILNDDETIKFYIYWSELTPKGKMKLQLQKSWETKGRMTTWGMNAEKFASNRKGE